MVGIKPQFEYSLHFPDEKDVKIWFVILFAKNNGKWISESSGNVVEKSIKIAKVDQCSVAHPNAILAKSYFHTPGN